MFQSCSFRVKVREECGPGGSLKMVRNSFEQDKKDSSGFWHVRWINFPEFLNVEGKGFVFDGILRFPGKI